MITWVRLIILDNSTLNMLKQLEINGCVPSTMVTDTLVLKHQTIGTHNTDQIFIKFE